MPPNGQTKFRSAYQSGVGIESGRLGLEDGPGIRLPLTQEGTYWQAPPPLLGFHISYSP